MDAAAAGLSEGEQRFDRARRRLGLWVAPTAFLAVLLSPTGLEPASHRLAAVLTLAMILWVTEAVPLPVTALLAPALAVTLGVSRARDAFSPFADPVIFLFLGSFLIAEALHVHGLDRRIALRILSLPGAARSSDRVRAAVALATAALSMWISNTATAAMMLPVGIGLVAALGGAGAKEPPRGLLLVIALAASVGGIATPVGTPPNLIGLGFLERLGGRSVDFLTFMAVGVPLSLAMLALTLLVVRVAVPRAGGGGSVAGYVESERQSVTAWGSGQWACGIAFALAVGLWLLPGFLKLLKVPAGGALGQALDGLDEAVVAVLVAALLFVWPVGERRALTWEEGKRIDWGTLFLFGGGLALGKMMFDTGLAAVLGRAGLRLTGVESLWGLTALAIASAILLTELTSNTAAVNMLAPLMLAVAGDLGVPVVPPVLGVCFGASMAFMLPISTPPNAIVYGTGLVPLTFMLRVGVILDALSFFVILGALRVLCPLLGLM
jgi:sodium-dependent dicarboxylate transporter 2/3/5